MLAGGVLFLKTGVMAPVCACLPATVCRRVARAAELNRNVWSLELLAAPPLPCCAASRAAKALTAAVARSALASADIWVSLSIRRALAVTGLPAGKDLILAEAGSMLERAAAGVAEGSAA